MRGAAEGAGRALSEASQTTPQYTGKIREAQIDGRPTLLLRYTGTGDVGAGTSARIDFYGVRAPLFSHTTGRLEVITTTAAYYEIYIFRHQTVYCETGGNVTGGNVTGGNETSIATSNSASNDASSCETRNVTLLINPNAIDDGSVALEDPTAGALTAARFSFHIFNLVPYLGQVCISLPPDFRFYGPASGFSFGGISRAASTGLGVGLVVERYGGGEGTVDDHRVCIHRRGEPVPSKRGLIEVRLTNIIVPLNFDADGLSGNFTVETKTEFDARSSTCSPSRSARASRRGGTRPRHHQKARPRRAGARARRGGRCCGPSASAYCALCGCTASESGAAHEGAHHERTVRNCMEM